ncbi:MAG: N-acetylmuramoyl-L-alanine amidase [Oscillospiraceae bacterium]|nr:N-acetylmuramoyl-L-alanine amidase [Oscillospiraceae bacterium]
MATLKPDRKYSINGVTVNEFLITAHNDNKVPVGYDMKGNRIGITIHNTARLDSVAETQVEQYSRATYNNNMGGVIVHFYVDETGAWQLLPLDISGFHAADGNGPGNRRTIAVECVMDGSGSDADKKSEENCARLVAGLLKMFDFEIGDIYTHNHWYPPKYCPAFILPHWEEFKRKVQGYLGETPSAPAPTEMYRIRKSWDDAKSQIGAYTNLDGAKKAWKEGYTIYNSKGEAAYPAAPVSSESIPVTVKTFEHTLRTLRNGMSGKDVKTLQQLLFAKGYACGADDGDFGPKTERSVMDFQKACNISVDGIVGHDTFKNLWGY